MATSVKVRKKGDHTCPYHKSAVVLSCKDCDVLVCLKCTTKTHKRHEFQDISEIALNTKSKIEGRVRKDENVNIPDIRRQIKCLHDKITENENSFENLEARIKPHREKMKVEIDRIIDNYIDTTRKIAQENHKLLSKYQQELESFYNQMSLCVDECKTALESDNDILVIDVGKEAEQEPKQPDYPVLLSVDQVASTFPVAQLKNVIVSIQDIQGKTTSQEVVFTSQQRKQQQNRQNEFDQPSSSTEVDLRTAISNLQATYQNQTNVDHSQARFNTTQDQSMTSKQGYPASVTQTTQLIYQHGSPFFYVQPSQSTVYPTAGQQIAVQQPNQQIMGSQGSHNAHPYMQYMPKYQTGIQYQWTPAFNQQQQLYSNTIYATQNQGHGILSTSAQQSQLMTVNGMPASDPMPSQNTSDRVRSTVSSHPLSPKSSVLDSGSFVTSTSTTPSPNANRTSDATVSISAVAAQPPYLVEAVPSTKGKGIALSGDTPQQSTVSPQGIHMVASMETQHPKVNTTLTDVEQTLSKVEPGLGIIETSETPEGILNEETVDPITKQSEKPELINNKRGHWSSLNHGGKYVYDRKFLLSRYSAAPSRSRPIGLPDIPNIVLDEPHDHGSDISSEFKFLPGYVRSPRVSQQSLEQSSTTDQMESNNKRGRKATIGQASLTAICEKDALQGEKPEACGRMRMTQTQPEIEQIAPERVFIDPPKLELPPQKSVENICPEPEDRLASRGDELSPTSSDRAGDETSKGRNQGYEIKQQKTDDAKPAQATLTEVFRKEKPHEQDTKKLEFTEKSETLENIQGHLQQLLSQKHANNEEILEWIESNLDEATTKTKTFIRTLMTAICSSAISDKGNNAKVDPRCVTARRVILQKYLDHRADFELQALYALQALVHKLEHPPDILQELFDTLYDEDVISENAFNQWHKSDDSTEQEGKDIAMNSVVKFFTWLGEAEDMSDS